MRPVPFSQAEENYIMEYSGTLTYREIAANVSFIFGNKRSRQTIHGKIQRIKAKELRLKDKEFKKPDPGKTRLYQNTTKKKERPVISTLQLIHAMNDTGHSIQSISSSTGILEAEVHEMVAVTGVPERHAERIKAVLGMK